MSEQITKLFIGLGGLGATEVVKTTQYIDPSVLTEAGSLIIQLIIGIVTLLGLLKKKKT